MLLLLLFFQLAFSTLTPALIVKRNPSDPDFENYLHEVLNNFRYQMKEGIPEIHVPSLDPLKLYNIKINVNENTAKIKLDFHQIIISGLSQFQIHELKASLDKLYVNVHLQLPYLMVNGNYYLNGTVMRIFPLRGNGKYKIDVTDAKLDGTGKMILDNDGLRFHQLKLYLSWGKLKLDFENLLNGGSFSKTIQKVIPVIGKGLFDHFKPEITDLIEKALINEVNKELKKPEVREIIEGLIPTDK
ncbi:uncharacterized protein [Centruroides vittatus]|uniref:uncharacterized protein n=1 Tax=Centruroides vittatus TaxID=120091 RepID=UPI0035109E03